MNKEAIVVLIVDDDPDEHFFINKALKVVDPEIIGVSVYNGAQAIDFLLNEGSYSDKTIVKPDIIITDLNMPKINGYELMKKIKDFKILSDIPVFVLSTTSDEQSKNTCLDLGAIKCYTKPPHGYDVIIREMMSKLIL